MAMQLRKRARVSYAPVQEEEEEEDDDEILQTIEQEDDDESDDSGSDVEETQAARKKRRLNKQKKEQHKQAQKKASKPKKEKALTPNQIFPFMQLPPELRNKIYELCLLQWEKKFVLKATTWRHRYLAVHQGHFRGPTMTEGSRINALQLNKSTHEEAASLLYAQEMHFDNSNVVQTFMAQIGFRNRERLRFLKMGSSDNSSSTPRQLFFAFNSLALAPNVEELHMPTSPYYWHVHRTDIPTIDGQRFAKKLCKEAMHWFETMALSKGTPFAGLSILKIAEIQFYSYGGPTYWRTQSKELYELQLSRAKTRRIAFENEVKKILTLRFKHTLAK